MTAEILSFETGRPAEIADGEPSLVVDVEGYEGPLDLLLTLARQQKVDLAKISILALADQYLKFIEEARKIRLELAADYLVMAAWLAFLKSRLLLPEPATPDGPSAEEMATALANRLRRLEAIREAANRLMNRPQFQRDIFPRGNPESIAEIRHPKFTATLFDLLSAYAAQRQQPGEIVGGAEHPFAGNAHQVDAARRVFRLQLRQGFLDVDAVRHPLHQRRLIDRLGGGKQQCFEQPQFLRPSHGFGFRVGVDGTLLGIFHAFFRQACHG